MGSFDATFGGHPFILRLNTGIAGQSIPGNYSVVNWNLQVIKTGSFTPHRDDGAATWGFNGAGGSWSPYSFNGAIGQTLTIASGQFTVNHNPDGTGGAHYAWSANGLSTITTASGAADETYPTIARQAGAPTATAVSEASSTSATLTWTAASAPAGAPVSSYLIQASTDPGFGSGVVQQSVGNVLSGTIGGLVPGTAPYVRVAAVNAAGVGPFSSARQVVLLQGVRVKLASDHAMHSVAVAVKINGTMTPCDVRVKRSGAMVGLT